MNTYDKEGMDEVRRSVGVDVDACDAAFEQTKTIIQITEAAQLAFWAEVVKQCPHVKTGDFPPDATFAIDHAMQSAITTWLHYNEPEIES